MLDSAKPAPQITAHDVSGGVRFAVRVQTRAHRAEISGVREDELRVRLTAPPVEGRANEELCRLLAARLKVPVGAVRIVRGERSRTKLIEVSGVSVIALALLTQ